MAQEFFAAFGHGGLGTIGTDTTINSSDLEGILTISVQALEKRSQALQAENADLSKKIGAMKAENAELNKEIGSLKARLEAKAENADLNKEIGAMKAENAELRERLEALERLLANLKGAVDQIAVKEEALAQARVRRPHLMGFSKIKGVTAKRQIS